MPLIRTETCSHLSAGQDVASQFNFSKVALADGFEEPVVADVRVVWARGHGVTAACTKGSTRRTSALLRAASRQRRVLHREERT